ncbi:OmpA family protein [Litorivicinus lipolyticus]|nr:OmpA family protein [Litorivicinus lipolyticus]
MKKTLLAVLIGSMSISGVVLAEAELSVGAGLINFDGDRNVDNDVLGKLGVGYRYPDSPFGAELSYSAANAEDTTNASFDARMFQLDGLYHLAPTGAWTPYLSAGVGEMKTETSAGAKNSDSLFSLGGGVKYALSEALDLRADLRGLRTDEANATDVVATLSMVFGLGGNKMMEMPMVADTDGDGVNDDMDVCPGTPAGANVDASGCELDEDRDGVVDSQDDCLGTAPGLAVDAAGCPVLQSEVVTFNLDVEFDTNIATIKSGYVSDIDNLASFLGEYPNTRVLLGGHTDSVGSAAFNMTLSQKRADAVKRALVARGVQSDRIDAKGFGESKPIADNMNAAGREQNRRVVASVSAVKKTFKASN